VVQVEQLVDQDTLEINCLGNEESPPKKLCLIAFLPNILDDKAAGRTAHIKASALPHHA
jgi:protein disulfide-isomerase A6